MTQRYLEVALPVPLRSAFTYAVPASCNGEELVGRRVLVPFRNRAMIGVGLAFSTRAPESKRIKEIAELLDRVPALPPKLIELGQWISRYYLAPIGEAFRAMLPPEIELRYHREYWLTVDGRAYLEDLTTNEENTDVEAAELTFLRGFEKQKAETPERALTETRVARMPGGAAAAEKFVRRGHLAAHESIRRRKIRTQKIAAWCPNPDERPIGQPEKRVREVLMDARVPLPLEILLERAAVTPLVIKRLESAGMLLTWEEPLTAEEDPWDTDFIPPTNVLNSEQKHALAEIWRWLVAEKFTAALLHGVTGSGKTEVYLGAIEAALSRGKTAIVLVPEIALTLWVGRLVRARFGEQVAILHSALPDSERAREWWRVRNGEARVVVGTRSAVFAPLENLGLIIVDEEQESSYKQEETPRYHGRDVAIVRAKLENAIALLGSATPSLETYHHARTGKYELLTLASRVANRSMASVEIIDMREDFQRTHQAGPISTALHDGITECLKQGTQALVLINRRGYSWSVMCRSCGASVQCANCSISMTYHKARNRLECHYCGSIQSVPKVCPKCQSKYVYFFGEGSEHLEERLRKEFPGARIARLDRDTARTKRQYQETLGAFAGGAIDILVGTQMLAKGHDFQRVTLVGVISADSSLHLPDFRAAERTFQLLTQVAGRAGRGDLPGRVLIQTYYPEHYAIQDAVRQDYASFFEREMHFRRMMQYPPFTSLANVIIRDSNLEKAIRYGRLISEYFAPTDGKTLRVLGPATAPLARLKTEHRFQFLLKSPRRSVLTKLLSVALPYADSKEVPQTAILVDMDPLNLL